MFNIFHRGRKGPPLRIASSVPDFLMKTIGTSDFPGGGGGGRGAEPRLPLWIGSCLSRKLPMFENKGVYHQSSKQINCLRVSGIGNEYTEFKSIFVVCPQSDCLI